MPWPAPTPERDLQRFMLKVEFAPDGCWNWTGRIEKNGYGRFHVGTRATMKSVLAHRWSYLHLVGPAEVLDHICRNRRCVNPAHLEPVTMRENVLRGVGPTAINAAKTECVNGHPFDETNTIKVPGGRGCRSCHKAYLKRYREEKKRAAAN